MRKFYKRILILGVLSGVIYVLTAILTSIIYTEPILTNSVSFDKKMYFLKEIGSTNVNVLAIGSSMTLNNFNSSIVQEKLNVGNQYLNLGAWGLQMSDIYTLIEYFSKRYSPKLIIICSSLTDFESDRSYFSIPNIKLLDAYFSGNNFLLYLKNNSINTYVERNLELKNSNCNNNDYKCLNYDRFGGVFLDIPINRIDRERWIRPIKKPKESQYRALEEISKYLNNKNIKLIFIQCPIKLKKESYIEDIAIIQSHILRVQKIISDDNNLFINGFDENDYNDIDFCDTYHLNMIASKKFTEKTISLLNLSKYFE